MLFNSATFLFGFLPVSLAGYFAAARAGEQAASIWLIAASLTFYGWFDPAFVPLLATSVGANYGIGRLIVATRYRPRLQAWVLRAGIAANLAALAYHKYLDWLVGLVVSTGLFHTAAASSALPLGISFFTFTQIGYLADVRDEAAEDRGPLSHAASSHSFRT